MTIRFSGISLIRDWTQNTPRGHIIKLNVSAAYSHTPAFRLSSMDFNCFAGREQMNAHRQRNERLSAMPSGVFVVEGTIAGMIIKATAAATITRAVLCRDNFLSSMTKSTFLPSTLKQGLSYGNPMAPPMAPRWSRISTLDREAL